MSLRINIRKLRALIWVACAVALAFAGWTFWDVYTNTKIEKTYEARTKEYYTTVLFSRIGEHTDSGQRVVYVEDRYEATWLARVDGSVKEVAAVAPTDLPQTEPEVVVPDLATIVDIGLVLWSPEPSQRVVALRYTPGANVPSLVQDKESRLHLAEGEVLLSPYDGAPYHGKVKAIGLQEVIFEWGGAEVALTPGLGTDGLGPTHDDFLLKHEEDPSKDYDAAPEETVQLGANAWLLGRRDMDLLRDDTDSVVDALSPRSVPAASAGRSAIELTDVKKGSLPEKFGAQSGDRIISINGFPMTSVPAALNWAKANPNESAYVVQYERAGKVLTTTIYVK